MRASVWRSCSLANTPAPPLSRISSPGSPRAEPGYHNRARGGTRAARTTRFSPCPQTAGAPGGAPAVRGYCPDPGTADAAEALLRRAGFGPDSRTQLPGPAANRQKLRQDPRTVSAGAPLDRSTGQLGLVAAGGGALGGIHPPPRRRPALRGSGRRRFRSAPGPPRAGCPPTVRAPPAPRAAGADAAGRRRNRPGPCRA